MIAAVGVMFLIPLQLLANSSPTLPPGVFAAQAADRCVTPACIQNMECRHLEIAGVAVTDIDVS